MFLLYDFAFILFAIVYLPIFIFRKKMHSKFKMKLGLFSNPTIRKMREREIVWVHAVSVGEVIAAKEIIDQLREKYWDARIIVSTVTKTGNEVARTITREDDLVLYLPLDISFIVKKVFRKTRIKCFVLFETELWPNLLLTLYRKKVPIFLVNGRISPRSFGRYLLIKPLLTPLLSTIRLFLMQSPYDVERIIRLGAPTQRVRMIGNIKFDVDALDEEYIAKQKTVFDRVKRSETDLFTIAGSTHPGEEKMILDSFHALWEKNKNVRLIIAPRHIERVQEIQKLVSTYLLSYNLFSEDTMQKKSNPVIILDTLGDLKYLYGLADIVFIGGSLVPRGGHNIIEPATLAKPIITGNYMFNFQDIKDIFLRKNAVIIVKNGNELSDEWEKLIADKKLRQEIGKRAEQVVTENRGVTKRILNSIVQNLERT